MHIRNVVMGSSWLWRSGSKHGQDAICEHLLSKGCRVEWFTIPLSLLHLLRPVTIQAKRDHIKVSHKPRKERVDTSYLINRVPFTLIHPLPNIPLLNSYFVSRTYLDCRIPSLATLARKDGIYPVDMVFFDSGGVNIYYPFKNKARVKVYRVSDFVAEFPNQVKGRIETEREILRKADIVLPVHEAMCDEAIRIRGTAAGVYCLPNGVDVAIFSKPYKLPPEYLTIPAPRAVIVGAFNTWYDMDLIIGVARLRPNISFCLIGPGSIPTALPKNIFVLGPRPHDQIPAYTQNASVGLIAYKDWPRIRRVERPLKFYDYLASGLPIVSVPYGGMTKMSPYALFGKSPAEFAEAIDAAIKYTDRDRGWLREAAQQFSWDKIFEKLDDIFRQHGFDVG